MVNEEADAWKRAEHFEQVSKQGAFFYKIFINFEVSVEKVPFSGIASLRHRLPGRTH